MLLVGLAVVIYLLVIWTRNCHNIHCEFLKYCLERTAVDSGYFSTVGLPYCTKGLDKPINSDIHINGRGECNPTGLPKWCPIWTKSLWRPLKRRNEE